eukprot:14997920-Alexandrium_andersonii.AAC.1
MPSAPECSSAVVGDHGAAHAPWRLSLQGSRTVPGGARRRARARASTVSSGKERRETHGVPHLPMAS